MVRFLTVTFALIVFSFVFGQVNTTPETQPVGKVFLSGQIVGAENQTLYLANQNFGGFQSPIAKIETDDDGKFSIEQDIPAADYYILTFPNNQLLYLILFGNDTITIYGDAKRIMEYSNFIGSPDSEMMNEFLFTWSQFKQTEDSLKNVLRMDPTMQAEVDKYYAPIAQEFYMKRNNLITKFPKSPAILATLNAIDQEKDWNAYQNVVHQLTLSFPQSPTVQGVAEYTNDKIKEREEKKFLEPGFAAKDIALPNPKGDTLRLSDLKGKVVLIDFWASWCKPCRLENPNVVNMYKLYKDDGFTVFSVSLDQNMEKWVQAIEADGLIWPDHVSDLKGWKSAAGADYKVSSIPFTVLIDQEGKIIGTNIRGPQLQNHLKAIFGH